MNATPPLRIPSKCATSFNVSLTHCGGGVAKADSVADQHLHRGVCRSWLAIAVVTAIPPVRRGAATIVRLTCGYGSVERSLPHIVNVEVFKSIQQFNRRVTTNVMSGPVPHNGFRLQLPPDLLALVLSLREVVMSWMPAFDRLALTAAFALVVAVVVGAF
jgi:hypothetical protein